jgi:hypothetical protein
VSDEWLKQLRQLHEADKAKREAEAPKKPEPSPQSRASELLQQSEAHKSLRQVQKMLLNGEGTLDIFDRAGDYDRVITLAWQGPISEARKPDPDDPEAYNYVLVGVRKDKLWVNGKALPDTRPDTLRAALLAACKKPGRETKRGIK